VLKISSFRMHTFLIYGFAVLVGLTALNTNLRAQSLSTGTILGTVSDPSGALIAGASVKATNTQTGNVLTTTTDAQGRYQFSGMPNGQYGILVEKAGFESMAKTGVALSVGGSSVVDFSMAVGQTLQTVTVEANAVQVDTTTAQISTLIDEKQLTDLPLNNRNLASLILLAPGVNVFSGIFQGAFYGGGFTFSVGGARPNGQAMVLDDSDVQDYYAHGAAAGALNTYMGVDAISQFQVLTNTYSAQFGGSGSVVNQATKSGTNSFHGTGYEFFRNSAMDARSWFDGSRTAPFRKNQFGGALGGPIKKDKMFFFTNYEGLRQLYAPVKLYTLPDSNTHSGLLPCNLLSAATPGSCPAVTKGNFTPQPLVNVGVAPSMAPYLAFFDKFFPRPPTELYSAAGLPTGTGQERINPPQVGTENYVIARYDWNISQNNSIFVRYLGDFSLLNNDNVSGPWHPDLEYNRNQFATVEEKHIFSPNLLNIGRFAFSRPFQRSDPGSVRFPIFCYYTAAECAAQPSDGGFTFGSGITAIGSGSPGPWRFNQNKFAFGDDVFWNHGAHSFKFGGEIKRVESDAWSPLGLGSWTFVGLQNLLAAVPSTFSGVLRNSSGALQENSYRYFRETQFALYAQDDWKILPTLTVNLGLRWEPGTNISEKNNNLNFILIPGNFINPALTSANAYTNVPNVFAQNPSLRNFDPRIGIAWDPFKDHKTSVRAGFGLFHNVIGPREFGAQSYNNPPFQTGTAQNPPFTVTANSALLKAAVPSQSFGLDYYLHNTPYVEQWNLNVEHEIAKTIITLGYVGSHSVHQIVETNLNPIICSPAGVPAVQCTAASNGPFATLRTTSTSASVIQNPNLNPAFGTLTVGRAWGFGRYNSAQLSVNRRLSNNFQTQLSYTYSECIDDGSGSYGVDGGTTYMDPYNHKYDIGWCGYYARNNITWNGLYILPFHKNQLVAGWQVSGIFTYHTGFPQTVGSGLNQAPIGGAGDRPNFVGGPGCGTTGNAPMVKNFAAQTVTGTLNPACFSLPPIGFLGNPVGRNAAFSPNYSDIDATIAKTTNITKISEQFAVQFRAEFFNIVNHANFAPAGTGLTPIAGLCSSLSPTGGCNLSPTFGQITTAQPGRQVQFGLKFIF